MCLFRLVGLVDEELVVGPDEEEGVFVVLLANPATAVLGIDHHVAVFAVNLLFGQQVVVLVVDLQVGVAVVFDDGVHDVAADAVGDEVNLVGLLHVVVHHNHIGHVVVIPVAVAVHPESGPVPGTRGQRIPEDGVAVHHIAVPGVVEVGGRVNRACCGGQIAAGVAGACIAAVAYTGMRAVHTACVAARGSGGTACFAVGARNGTGLTGAAHRRADAAAGAVGSIGADALAACRSRGVDAFATGRGGAGTDSFAA